MSSGPDAERAETRMRETVDQATSPEVRAVLQRFQTELVWLDLTLKHEGMAEDQRAGFIVGNVATCLNLIHQGQRDHG